MTSRRATGVVASLVTCALFACSYRDNDDQHDDNNFRADVIECEDALDRLHTCCSDFDVTVVQCDFDFSHTEGCGSSSTQSVHPAFTLDESQCIRDTSCGELQSSGVCKRAQAARAYSVSDTEDDSFTYPDSSTITHVATTHAPVCP